MPGPTKEFRAHQRPRSQSPWVVEECLSYRVGDEVPIQGMEPLPLYSRKVGNHTRRYFQCLPCRRLVETLFLVPSGINPDGSYQYDVSGIRIGDEVMPLPEWRCRRCLKLRYNSQRRSYRGCKSLRKQHHKGDGPAYWHMTRRLKEEQALIKRAAKWEKHPPRIPAERLQEAIDTLDAIMPIRR